MVAAEYPTRPKELIDERMSLPKQGLNTNGMGLFWKSITSHTYVEEEEKSELKHKDSKAHLALLICANTIAP